MQFFSAHLHVSVRGCLDQVIYILLVIFVGIYRIVLAPHFMAGGCRFSLTCSAFALRALKKWGGVKGGWLTLRRLLCCHPFGKR